MYLAIHPKFHHWSNMQNRPFWKDVRRLWPYSCNRKLPPSGVTPGTLIEQPDLMAARCSWRWELGWCRQWRRSGLGRIALKHGNANTWPPPRLSKNAVYEKPPNKKTKCFCNHQRPLKWTSCSAPFLCDLFPFLEGHLQDFHDPQKSQLKTVTQRVG